MRTPTCSNCRRPILSGEVNVAQDVAYCRACNISHRLSELARGDEITASIDLNHPPQGAWLVDTGSSTGIGATNRNLANGVGFLFFALFWNGSLSIFLLVAISATLHNLHLGLPSWFPTPVMNGAEMTVGPTLFLWIFLTPFILIGIFFAVFSLSSLFGRTEVGILGSWGTVFTGIGALGWKQRFEIAQVKRVGAHRRSNSEGEDTYSIVIERNAGKPITFGSLLTDERRRFVLAALQKYL
jgi:hypothetical protein